MKKKQKNFNRKLTFDNFNFDVNKESKLNRNKKIIY